MANESMPDIFGLHGYESEVKADEISIQLFGRSPQAVASTISDGQRTVAGDDFGYCTSARSMQLVHARGEDPRTGVAIELPAGLDWAYTAYACLYLGLRIVPIDRRWHEDRRRLALESCAVHLTRDTVQAPIGRQEWVDPRPIDWQIPALELQSSGTSGKPKRIVHSRGSLTAQAVLGGRAVGLHGGSHWLAALPMAHAAGIGVFVRSLAYGGPMTLLPEFAEDRFLSLLEGGAGRPAASVVSLVPTMLSRLLDAGWVRPEHLEAAIIGGAPLDIDLRGRALESGIPIRESWGMTETLGMISVARTTQDHGSGRPLPGVEVRSDEHGELLVRGPIVAPGLADPDGWFHTGDSGYVDDQGSVHVEGRIGSMIISGGENVFPESVERALLATGLVSDAWVKGEADPQWGERVVAFVVPRFDDTQPGQIREAVARSLSPWEVPKEIECVDSINRNELGKLKRGSDD